MESHDQTLLDALPCAVGGADVFPADAALDWVGDCGGLGIYQAKHMSDCPTCVAIVCDTGDDTSLYSLQSEIFPFVLNCPAGYDCNEATSFNMLCCNRLLTTQFGPNFTVDDKATAINQLVNQCAAILPQCGENPTCNTSPCPPVQLYYNQPATCQMPCPDGTLYTYTVPAGTFAATSQSLADQQAQDYACQQALSRRICLSSLPPCTCLGLDYSATVRETGGVGPFIWSLMSGTLPSGTSLNSVTGEISGTLTTNGKYTFTVRVTSLTDGSYNQKTYSVTVLEITTASITGYTVGAPYSFQMEAAGGSGTYAWKITSGTLPDGLSMSVSGLISGTPTGGTGVQPITFEVIDTNCETTNNTFFPPQTKLVTTSRTRIATLLGFSEYPGFVSSPPKKYKTLTWEGSSEQLLWFPGGSVGNSGATYQVAGSRFDYSGASSIDSKGNYTSVYVKNLSSMCSATGTLVTTFVPGVSGGLDNYVFTGWLGPTGHEKCAPPGIPYNPVGDQAIGKGQAAIMDSSPFWGSKKPSALSNIMVSDFNAISATEAICFDSGGDQNLPVFIALYEPLPQGVTPSINNTNQGTVWFFAGVTWAHDYTANLSDEYTDAEALTNAQVINGNGATADNNPRTTGFVSRFTSVDFQIQCSNLVPGSDYVVSYDLWDQLAGTITTTQVGFSATATTKTITGTVPTPSEGHQLTIRNARINFS